MTAKGSRASYGVAWAIVLAGATGCGARSQLHELGSGGAPTVAGAGGATGSTASVGGMGAGASPPCMAFGLEHPPTIVLQHPGRDVHTPSVVATEPGRVVVEAVDAGTNLPMLELVSLALGAEGITVAQGPTPFASTFTWAPLAQAHDDPSTIAMLWKNESLDLGRFDVTSWSPAAITPVAVTGGTPFDLVAGAGLGPNGVGHSGAGYGALYLGETMAPTFVVLDPEGAPWLAPTAVTAPSSIVSQAGAIWSGSHYLVAAQDPEACDDPEDCGAVSVFRYRPATGDLVDDSELERVFSFGIEVHELTLGRVGDEVWLMYLDPGGYDGVPPTRLLRMGIDGTPLGEAVTLGPSATSVRFVATPVGVVVAVDTGITPSGEVSVFRTDEEGSMVGEPFVVFEDAVVSWGPHPLVALDDGAAIAVSAPAGDDVAVYLATVRCADAP